ncbi:hypothetical protein ACWCSD_31875 [Nonomuraea sp. NPDC001684]
MSKTRELDRDLLGDVLFLGIGAVVLWVSFDTLTHLAELSGWATVWVLPNGWTIRMAWALPVAVDFYAIATARAWLMRRKWVSQATRDHARLGAWWAIGGSVVLNSVSHALTMLRYRAESGHGVILAVLIGAVPPVVLAAIAHLRALQNQDRAEAAERDRARAERAAEQQARRLEAKSGTGARPNPGTGTPVPQSPGTGAVPAPAGTGTAPVPAVAPGTSTAPATGTGPGNPLVPPRPRPSRTARPAPAPPPHQEQEPDADKGTTLLTAQDLDFAEQFMKTNPGVTPTKQNLMDGGMGSNRALRIRAYIETAVKAAGTSTAAQAGTRPAGARPEKPVPADTGTATPLPAGTDSGGTEPDSPRPADTDPSGTGANSPEPAGTDASDAGTDTAVNQ